MRIARHLATVLAFVSCAACGGAVIEPGHRGMLFDPKSGGLHHEILLPGYYRLGSKARIEDYDVTYSRGTSRVRATTSDGDAVDLAVTVVYRPIIAELYQLATEAGHGYYGTVVQPAVESAARSVIEHAAASQLTHTTLIEDEVEAHARRLSSGRHVEISSIVLKPWSDYANASESAHDRRAAALGAVSSPDGASVTERLRAARNAS
jgi:regulator of protease activity HflC (stomatin/prohibitin superfamily)